MSTLLPSWQSPLTTRPAASEINSYANTGQNEIYSGYNEIVPLVYGRKTVRGGPLLAAKAGMGAMPRRGFIMAFAFCRVNGKPIGGVTRLKVDNYTVNNPAYGSNPPAISLGGDYQVWIYDGTQTEPNSLLQGWFDDFTDVYADTAYIVVSVDQERVAGVGATPIDFSAFVELDILGRQCYDPRTGLWVATENPSLHLRDFITDEEYGLGRDVLGAEACADENDALFRGVAKAMTSITLNEPSDEAEILDLMSVYAECFWTYEGAAIRLIPDAPVEAPAGIVTLDQIRWDTLEISSVDQSDVPTALSVIYSGGDRPATVTSSEHESIGTVGSQSGVELPGVYRPVEAQRRAWSRFQRLQVPGRISFQMFDDGVQYQVGDVVEIPDYFGTDSVWVRITSPVEPVAVGIYQLHGEVYTPSAYPADVDGAMVPIGGVLFRMGGSSSGSNLLSNYDLVRGVAAQSEQGLQQAVFTAPDVHITINSGGAHSGAAHADEPIMKFVEYQKTAPMVPNPNYISWRPENPRTNPKTIPQSPWPPVAVSNNMPLKASNASAGGHTHTASFSVDPLAIQRSEDVSPVALVQIQSHASYNPVGLSFLSVGSISAEGIALRYGEGRLLGGSSNGGTVLAGVKSAAVYTGYADNSHQHANPTLSSISPSAGKIWGSAPSDVRNDYFTSMRQSSGNHRHRFTANYSYNAKRIGVMTCELAAQSEGLIPKGGIIGWLGGAVPQGWALCDGTNGTPDMVDRFIEFARSSDAGKKSGNNTAKITFSASTDPVAHAHGIYSAAQSYVETEAGVAHSSDVSHSHSITAPNLSFSFVPRHYAMRFIQYKGE